MPKTKIAILGVGGMLGSMVLDVFAKDKNYRVFATVHNSKDANKFRKLYPNITIKSLDVEWTSPDKLANTLKGNKWIINAIGIIKPYIHDDNPEETERALRVNALFPHYLSRAADSIKAQVIQIATDCVYSGKKGKYIETDEQDALDVYGKTKSLGEAYGKNIYHIRCSIIGPEIKGHLSLMDWFLTQPKGAKLNGFKNHRWNGVTTLHFAYLCRGIIEKNIKLNHIQHIVPTGTISKASMLQEFARDFNRSDIIVTPVDAPKVIDRTCSTSNKSLNNKIWKAAGYKKPPTVKQMIRGLSQYQSQQ